MGYSKTKALGGELSIPMDFRVDDRERGIIEFVTVVHHVKFPDKKIREQYSQDAIKVRGRKARSNVSPAAWNMWVRIINRVEGYEDLPEADRDNVEKLKNYFDSDVERIHVDECITRVNELIGAEDADLEKKSEQSSVG